MWKQREIAETHAISLLPDKPICGLCLRQECWERFPDTELKENAG